MPDIKKSGFEPILDKTFAEIFSEIFESEGRCPKCHKGFKFQLDHRRGPDCSNVFCDWNRKRRSMWD